MKKNLQISALVLLFLGFQIAIAEKFENQSLPKPNYFELSKQINQNWNYYDNNKKNGWKQFKRWEHFWETRLWPDGEFPDFYEKYIEIDKLSKNDTEYFLERSSNWEELGPVIIPTNQLNYKSSGLGRINCVTIHPDNSNIIWVGAAAGGAWKSSDKGKSWKVADFTDFMSMGVTDIAFSKQNPDIMYIATGDSYGISMTSAYSIGIIKSTDGGQSWKTTNLSRETSNGMIASKILVHPNDDNILFAATNQGIFKSIDAGDSWELKISNESFIDLVFNSKNPDILFAATISLHNGYVRIYKSNDTGETWKSKLQVNNGARIKLAVTPHDDNYVYAIVAQIGTYGMEGLFRSVNGGENWQKLPNVPNLLARDVAGADTDGQGHYDLALTVAPYNKDIIWAGGIHIWKSLNAGMDWSLVNHWTGSYGLPYVHADIHNLVFDEKTLDLFAATDGGLFITTNQGNSWSDLSNGLSIMQFYKISHSLQRENYLLGGSQDNGSNKLISGKWSHILGGDGMANAFNPQNDANFYISNPNGTFYKTTNSGSSFTPIIWQGMVQEYGSWVSPIAINHNNPEILYVGFLNIIKSTNFGANWSKISNFGHTYETFNEIALAPSNPDIIYAAARNYLYRKIENANWEKIYTAARIITDIAIDNNDPMRFWISLSGYDKLNKVMEYNKGTWIDISSGLPGIPANTIVHVDDTQRDLFAGTDAGVYYYIDDIDSWVLFNNNLPLVIIKDLHINYSSGKLIAGTFSRGIWQTEIIECELPKPTVKLSGQKSFCNGDSLTLTSVGSYYDFEWSNGEKTPSITIKESGEYYLRVYDEKGCAVNSDVIEVEVFEVKDVRIMTINRNSICIGDTIILSAFPEFSSYLWSTGETTKNIEITEAGDYWVRATNENGCQSMSEVISYEAFEKPTKPEIKITAGGLKSTESNEYQWYLNGEKILNARSQYYLPDEALEGEFQVEIFNENGCSSISDKFYHNFSNIESNVISNQFFKLSPNPNNGKFALIYNNFNFSKIKINIQDFTGKLIMEKVLILNGTNGEVNIDISDFSNGTYFVEIQFSGNRETIKFIKNE